MKEEKKPKKVPRVEGILTYLEPINFYLFKPIGSTPKAILCREREISFQNFFYITTLV